MTSSPTAPPALDLEASRDLLDNLEGLGWLITDGLGGISLVSPVTTEPGQLQARLTTLDDVIVDCRLIGRRGFATLRLRRTSSSLLIDQLPDCTPADLFEDIKDQRFAQELWSGEGEVALKLPFEWRAEAEINLESLVTPRLGDTRVSRHSETIQTAFTDTPYWILGRLMPPTGRRTFVALDAPPHQVDAGSLSFTGAQTSVQALTPPQNLTVTEKLADLPELPSPGRLISFPGGPHADPSGTWSTLLEFLQNAAAAAALCHLATDVRMIGDHPGLSFRGLRKTTIELAYPPANAQAVLDLFRWTFVEQSPDRLLAVQQVASLQGQDELIAEIGNIRSSAEIVYQGLRSNAVAEAVEGYRDAHSSALEAARQTVKSVQEMTKASIERALASVIAVGAILIARASTTLDPNVSGNLLRAVAGFLILLAAISLILEGPLASVPLRNLPDDLSQGSPLLSPSQVKALSGSETLQLARRRATTVRVAVPVMYVLAAIAVLVFVVPQLPNP